MKSRRYFLLLVLVTLPIAVLTGRAFGDRLSKVTSPCGSDQASAAIYNFFQNPDGSYYCEFVREVTPEEAPTITYTTVASID